jgi:hypothetical protein
MSWGSMFLKDTRLFRFFSGCWLVGNPSEEALSLVEGLYRCDSPGYGPRYRVSTRVEPLALRMVWICYRWIDIDYASPQ